MSFQIPRGLFDILPFGVNKKFTTALWQYVENIIKKIAKDYNFKEIRTPIFERTELFVRTSGEASDIVNKEMYTFLDKSKRSMTLRPEGTAPFIRAFVENNLANFSYPLKFYYIEPMFRYDRPQKGRYRQHHQFGVEYLGNTSYYQDAEVIDLLMQFYKRLQLKNLTLHINSVGDTESRENFKKVLKKFLQNHLKNLSKESQKRFFKNPLRILDSKDPEDQKILKKAPSILDHLNSPSKKYFESLCSVLQKQNIPFNINKNLVRGLDYYTHSVFEITQENLGSQNSLGGGGRYDGLVKNLKGPDLSGIGFGTGIERVIETMVTQNIPIEKDSLFIIFLPLCKKAEKISFEISTKLRHLQIQTEVLFNIKKIQKGLQKASALDARYAVILGEEEIQSKQWIIKNMEQRLQETIDEKNIIAHITTLWEDYAKI